MTISYDAAWAYYYAAQQSGDLKKIEEARALIDARERMDRGGYHAEN